MLLFTYNFNATKPFFYNLFSYLKLHMLIILFFNILYYFYLWKDSNTFIFKLLATNAFYFFEFAKALMNAFKKFLFNYLEYFKCT
jgi:hypothetical protein